MPIKREFVHSDGQVVPLDEKLLVLCLDALEAWVVDQLKAWGFSFVDVPYREAKNLGVNLVALGNHKVLSMQGANELNAKMRAWGFRFMIRICRCLCWAGRGELLKPSDVSR